MKRIIIMAGALLLCGVTSAQQAEVSIKKGKAKMDEAYYYQLVQKANAYESLVKESEENKQKMKQLEEELRIKNETIEPRTFDDSASYAIGWDLSNAWKQQQLGINTRLTAQAFQDINNGGLRIDPQDMGSLLQRFQSNFENRQRQQQEEMMASKDKNKEASEKFLKENAKSKAIHTTKSGLQYKIIEKGSGKKPTPNSTVKVHYTGTLIDGTKFDSSIDRGQPLEFPVGAVIPGWIEGLQLMNEGAHYILYIPPELGYGEQVAGSIPPNSVLIFDMQLIEVVN